MRADGGTLLRPMVLRKPVGVLYPVAEQDDARVSCEHPRRISLHEEKQPTTPSLHGRGRRSRHDDREWELDTGRLRRAAGCTSDVFTQRLSDPERARIP